MSNCLVYWQSLWHKDTQRVNFPHSIRDWYWFTALFLADKKLHCILKPHSYQASLHLERLHLHSLNGFIQEFFLFILRRLLCCWLDEKRNQTKENSIIFMKLFMTWLKLDSQFRMQCKWHRSVTSQGLLSAIVVWHVMEEVQMPHKNPWGGYR